MTKKIKNRMGRLDVAWRGVAWRGVAWRGVAWRGVAWRGINRICLRIGTSDGFFQKQ